MTETNNMSDIKNEIKQALEDASVLPWQYRELHRTIEYDSIQDVNGKNIISIASYDQANVDFLLLAVNNISSLLTTVESQQLELKDVKTQSDSHYTHFLSANDEADVLFKKVESQKEEIEKLQNIIHESVLAGFRESAEKVKEDTDILKEIRVELEKMVSLKAITELAVKGLKEIVEYSGFLSGDDAQKMRSEARITLSEIEKLSNG